MLLYIPICIKDILTRPPGTVGSNCDVGGQQMEVRSGRGCHVEDGRKGQGEGRAGAEWTEERAQRLCQRNPS
jgi:hypothetical protein